MNKRKFFVYNAAHAGLNAFEIWDEDEEFAASPPL